MRTLLELFESVDSDDAAHVLPTLITWPRTETVRDTFDSAALKIVQQNLNLDAVAKEADTDVELHATGRRDVVTLLRMLKAHKHSLMMLTKVDNLLVYHNGTLAVRVSLNETQSGRSAAMDVLRVRAALEKITVLSNTSLLFVSVLIVGIVRYMLY